MALFECECPKFVPKDPLTGTRKASVNPFHHRFIVISRHKPARSHAIMLNSVRYNWSMPKYKPCSYPGCRALIEGGGTRCPDHIKRRWRSDKLRGNASQRGYGAEWRKARHKALERDQYLCVRCASRGMYRQADQVDHIIRKRDGGTDDLANLQSLCTQCHHEKTIEERNNP